MKLQRYRTYTLWDEEGNPLDERLRSVFRVFDVLEWRDSIRAAVAAERGEAEYVLDSWSVPDQQDTRGRWWSALAALDALLPADECSSLCAPGSGERCMVTDDGRCPNGGA